MNDLPHQYVSTACAHKLCAPLCRRVCKYCPAVCVCPCHVGEDPAGRPDKPFLGQFVVPGQRHGR